MTPTFPERTRPHEEPHIRPVAVQTLDTLVRIEEVLERIAALQQVLVDALPPQALVDAVTEEVAKAPPRRRAK